MDGTTFEKREDFFEAGAGIKSLKRFAPNGQSVKLDVFVTTWLSPLYEARANGFITLLHHLQIRQPPLTYQHKRWEQPAGVFVLEFKDFTNALLITTFQFKVKIWERIPHLSQSA